MVKHNNVIPNQHFHKKWSSTSRGPLKVKCYFNQPAQKKVRRLKRAEKAAAIAPRPSDGALRPAVACPTNRYNSKVRLGRGFNLLRRLLRRREPPLLHRKWCRAAGWSASGAFGLPFWLPFWLPIFQSGVQRHETPARAG